MSERGLESRCAVIRTFESHPLRSDTLLRKGLRVIRRTVIHFVIRFRSRS